MNGYFITLYDRLTDLLIDRNITGYLYCCEIKGCNNVMKVVSKTEKLVCSQCGERIEGA